MKKADIKKPPNKIIILSLALTVVTLVLGIVAIYLPFLNKTKSVRSEILVERDRNVLAGKIRALDKHLKVYRKRIPEGRGVSWLLNEVSDMAAKENVEVSSVKPGAPEDRGRYTKLYVVMDATCAYNELGRFASRIESSEKFLRIENINMKRLDSEEGVEEKTEGIEPFDLKVNIVISTIVLKE